MSAKPIEVPVIAGVVGGHKGRLDDLFPRLLRVDGRDLHVTDLDADDGTLVVDLVAVFEEFRGPGRC